MSLFNSSVGLQRIRECLKKGNEKIHFIGILGAGMSPLAQIMAQRGYEVSGSDTGARDSEPLPGIAVSGVHIPALVHGCSLVVYSLAIDEENSEYRRAGELNILRVSRAELLAYVMDGYLHRIGVSGTHGKSTTVAMLDCILTYAGLSPTVISGAELSCGNSVKFGKSDYFVYEGCEYRDSFLRFSPTVQIITNIEYDHTDYFKSVRRMEKSFLDSVNLTRDAVFINSDDPISRKIAALASVPCITYGLSQDSIYRAVPEPCKGYGSCFSVFKKRDELCRVELSVIGRGNLYDALAAFALCHTLGIPADVIGGALSTFSGIARRIQYLRDVFGRPLYYDYAHHPTEIINTTEALRTKHGRVTLAFCPHTYSRTEALFNGFVKALSGADCAVILPIYPAREQPIAGVTSERLAEAVGGGCIALDAQGAFEYIRDKTDGAIVLMGAGDLGQLKGKFESL